MSAARHPRAAASRSAPHTSNGALELEALASALAPLLAAHLAPAPLEPEPLIDSDAAGELLGVPASWVRAQARAGRIPHVRLGHYVRFDRAELLTWRAAQAAGPATGTGPVPRRTGAPMRGGRSGARGARGPTGGPK